MPASAGATTSVVAMVVKNASSSPWCRLKRRTSRTTGHISQPGMQVTFSGRPSTSNASFATSRQVIVWGPPTAISDSRLSMASAQTTARSAPWIGLTYPVRAPSDQPHPALARHLEDTRVGPRSSRSDAPPCGRSRRPRARQRTLTSCASTMSGGVAARARRPLSSRDIDELLNTGSESHVEQVLVALIVDVAEGEPVLLSRDTHGGEHRVDSIADVLERFGPGDLGLDDLVQGVPKRDELLMGERASRPGRMWPLALSSAADEPPR